MRTALAGRRRAASEWRRRGQRRERRRERNEVRLGCACRRRDGERGSKDGETDQAGRMVIVTVVRDSHVCSIFTWPLCPLPLKLTSASASSCSSFVTL